MAFSKHAVIAYQQGWFDVCQTKHKIICGEEESKKEKSNIKERCRTKLPSEEMLIFDLDFASFANCAALCLIK